MSPHDATARAKADPVLFLMDVFDRVEESRGGWWTFDNPTTNACPLTVVYNAMGRVVRDELAAGGIEHADDDEREPQLWYHQQEQFERDNPDDDLGLLIDPWGL